MSYTKSTALLKSEFAEALKLSEKFNIRAADVRPNRQVRATLSQALDFLAPVANAIGRKGAVIEVGSARTGPDVFLDVEKARQLARKKERTAYLTGTVDVALSQKDHANLSAIRKAFKLSSDKQAAVLSLRVYNAVCDNLWRGNGFSLTSGTGETLDLNTAKEQALVRNWSYKSGQ